MATGVVKTITADKRKSFAATLTEEGRVLAVARGNGFTLRVIVRDADGTIADLSDHSLLKVSYMEATRTGNAYATKSSTITNATFTEAQATAGTHWHAEFDFTEADMNPDLGGNLEKVFWYVLFGTASVGGGEITHGGGNLQIIEDGTANTVLTPSGPETGTTPTDVVNLIAANGATVKTSYEGESNTNAFTDSEKAKLAAIDANHYGPPVQDTTALAAIAEADATDKERRFVEDEGTDYFYDTTATSGDVAPTDQTGGTGWWRRLPDGVETAASVKAKYESNADTNVFTDSEQSKLAGLPASAPASADAIVRAGTVPFTGLQSFNFMQMQHGTADISATNRVTVTHPVMILSNGNGQDNVSFLDGVTSDYVAVALLKNPSLSATQMEGESTASTTDAIGDDAVLSHVKPTIYWRINGVWHRENFI